AAGGLGAVRRLRHRQGIHRADGADDGAVLPCAAGGAGGGRLSARLVAVAARASDPLMTRARLSSHTVTRLAPAVRRYAYSRGGTGIGIVHLGAGAFMRAHVAVYCDEAMGVKGGDWAIAGVSLRRSEVRDRLAPQDCLYVVGTFDGESESRRLVGSLKSV